MTEGSEGRSSVSKSVVEGLKGNPLTLALIVITLVFMYFVYSGVQASREDVHEVMKVMVERCIK